jgi:hypothetical protein
MALRRAFGLKRDEIMKAWRQLYNEEIETCTLRQI